MNTFEKAIELIGHKVNSKSTGYIGIVVKVSFNLKGELTATTCPFGELDISNLRKGIWNWTQEFKVDDLEVLSEERVVDIPDFNNGE